MKNLKDIILEKLKISKNVDFLSFTFDDLCKSILEFVDKNAPNSSVAFRLDTEYVIKINRLDYFKDNPLFIIDDTLIKGIDTLKGCKVGMIYLNTINPQMILVHEISNIPNAHLPESVINSVLPCSSTE